MKKIFFVFLVVISGSFCLQIYCQTATSIQSPTDNKDWITTSGFSGAASSSQIFLDGKNGIGGDVKILSGTGSSGNGIIELQTQNKILLKYGTTENTSVKVGIGYNNPVEALHINGYIRGNLTGGALRINTANGTIDIGPQSSTCANINTDRNYFLFNQPVSSSGNFLLKTDGTTRMVIESGGKVGIGSTTPIGKFQVGSEYRVFLDDNICVAGTGWKTNMIGFNAVRRSDGLWETKGDGSYNGGAVIATDTQGGFHYYSFPSTGTGTTTHNDAEFVSKETFSIDPSGSLYVTNALRIGTYANADAYRLSVDGKIIAEEIVVKMSENWPDYVFDNSYKIRSLTELESYVRENNHLPNVPSAKEVDENGLAIGEMNRILLEKIEETTIYLIELKKQNDQLLKRIEELEKH